MTMETRILDGNRLTSGLCRMLKVICQPDRTNNAVFCSSGYHKTSAGSKFNSSNSDGSKSLLEPTLVDAYTIKVCAMTYM